MWIRARCVWVSGHGRQVSKMSEADRADGFRKRGAEELAVDKRVVGRASPPLVDSGRSRPGDAASLWPLSIDSRLLAW